MTEQPSNMSKQFKKYIYLIFAKLLTHYAKSMQNQYEIHWNAIRPFAKFAKGKEKNTLTGICQERITSYLDVNDS